MLFILVLSLKENTTDEYKLYRNMSEYGETDIISSDIFMDPRLAFHLWTTDGKFEFYNP